MRGRKKSRIFIAAGPVNILYPSNTLKINCLFPTKIGNLWNNQKGNASKRERPKTKVTKTTKAIVVVASPTSITSPLAAISDFAQ